MKNFLYEINELDKVAVFCPNDYACQVILTTNKDIQIVGGWSDNNTRYTIEHNGYTIPVYESLKGLTLNTDAHTLPTSVILLLYGTIMETHPFTMKYNHVKILKLLNEIKETVPTARKVYVVCGIAFSYKVINLLYSYADSVKIELHIVPYFDARYLLESPENMCWYSESLDPDLQEELEIRGIKGGKFLDIGTGAGDQATALAKMNFDVVATDIVPYAFIEKDKKLGVKFITDDILDSRLEGKFDYIVDRCTFHNFILEEEQKKYIDKISTLLKDDGLLFMFFRSSENFHEEALDPYYFTMDKIVCMFKNSFTVLKMKQISMHNLYDHDFEAIFTVMKKADPQVTGS